MGGPGGVPGRGQVLRSGSTVFRSCGLGHFPSLPKPLVSCLWKRTGWRRCDGEALPRLGMVNSPICPGVTFTQRFFLPPGGGWGWGRSRVYTVPQSTGGVVRPPEGRWCFSGGGGGRDMRGLCIPTEPWTCPPSTWLMLPHCIPAPALCGG